MTDKMQQYFGFAAMPFGRDLAPAMLHRPGISHSRPSMLIFRHGPRNAPGVSSVATGLATCANTSLTGSCPSRCLACVSPPVVTVACDGSQQPQSARVSDSRTQVSS